MALLLVLGALMVVAAAALVLVRVRATAALDRRVSHRTTHIDQFIEAADGPIRGWLERDSAMAVVPPEADSPALAILDDVVAFDDIVAQVRIGAFDQHGMLPWDDARSASPLRHALPPSVRARVNEVPSRPRGAPGLDLLPPPREGEAPTFPAIPSVQGPEGQAVAPVAFGGASAAPAGPGPAGALPLGHALGPASPTPPSNRAGSPDDQARPESPAVGAWLATHTDSPAEVNVNTAPRELLDEAMRRLGRGGVEEILDARRQGQSTDLAGVGDQAGARLPASVMPGAAGQATAGAASQRSAPSSAGRRPLVAPAGTQRTQPSSPVQPVGGSGSQPSTPASASQRTSRQDITLVSTSRTWSFRVDVAIDGTMRSQWSVWTLGPGGWECVQRLEVTP